MKIGDEITWNDSPYIARGGRPKENKWFGEGYVECGLCGKDFFVNVLIEGNKIMGVDVNSSKAPLIP
jgi:hypothetical protein